MNFQILAKMDDFSNFAKNDDFSTCSQNWCFFKFLPKRWFFKIWQKMMICHFDDFLNFGQKWWFFKILTKIWKNYPFWPNWKNIFYGSWCCLSVTHDTGVVSVLPTLSQHWTLYSLGSFGKLKKNVDFSPWGLSGPENLKQSRPKKLAKSKS